MHIILYICLKILTVIGLETCAMLHMKIRNNIHVRGIMYLTYKNL